MKLTEIALPPQHMGWTSSEDISKGLGRLMHKIQVQASYDKDLGRWIDIKRLLQPEWEVEKHFGGPQGVVQMLEQLAKEGKIEIDHNRGAIRINPELVGQEQQHREQMGKYIQDYEKGGNSFTHGT